MNHPLSDMMTSSMGKIRDMIDVNTVIGDPITTPSGTVIIPVSKVSMGIATGGLDYGKKSAEKAPDGQKRPTGKSFGGGGGTGISVTPVAFLVVGPEGGVEMLSVGADVFGRAGRVCADAAGGGACVHVYGPAH